MKKKVLLKQEEVHLPFSGDLGRFSEFLSLPVMQQRAKFEDYKRSGWIYLNDAYLKVTEDKVLATMVHKEVALGRKGNYYPSCHTEYISYNRKTKKIYTSANTGIVPLKELMEASYNFAFVKAGLPRFSDSYIFRVEIMRDALKDKNVLKGIFNGTITNIQEAVIRLVSSKYGIRVGFIEGCHLCWNIQHLVMPIGMLEAAIGLKNLTREIPLLSLPQAMCTIHDSVEQAFELGRKLNMSWSMKRLENEHILMSRALMQKRIEAKPTVPVWDNDFVLWTKTIGIDLINTERRCFEEGMMQDNCIWTNYWSQIEGKKYIAFHVDLEQPVTVGLIVKKDFIVFDQAYYAKNKDLSYSDSVKVQALVNRVKEYFIKYHMFVNKKDTSVEEFAAEAVLPW